MSNLKISRLVAYAMFTVVCACSGPSVRIDDNFHKNKNLAKDSTVILPLAQPDGKEVAAIIISESNLPGFHSATDSSVNMVQSANVGVICAQHAESIASTVDNSSLRDAHTPFVPWPDVAVPITGMKRYFVIDFENDVFTNTDLYFTNGTQLTLIHPVFQHLKLAGGLPGLGKSSLNHYGMKLRQNLYTSIDPEATAIDRHDRPFAGILYVSFFKISTRADLKLRWQSEVIIGTVGSGSLAHTVQQSLHQKEPVGWDFQIKNDILLNYNMQLEKGIVASRQFEAIAQGGLMAGTYATNGSVAFQFRFGKFRPYFNDLSFAAQGIASERNATDWQYWVFINPGARFVLYDVTLNGGVFNRNSPHTFGFADTKHLVGNIETGFVVAYKGIGLQSSLTAISPEFKRGMSHKWGAFKLFFNF
ncbi:MAG: lipid A deacylase LpxR family protein [Bacteroidetes bacterium]|nr:lipid A deacylase LpxR family protein [Bacteroidota bacterium]